MSLYPLKFDPIFKEKIWGGQKLKSLLGKNLPPRMKIGESWEISGVKGSVSVANEGMLAGQSLQAIVEEYKEKLVGQKVYVQYGNEFPMLIKFLDANDELSVQVHPNDDLAKKRHNSLGKTEMWYIIQADEGAKMNVGFEKKLSKESYLDAVKSNRWEEILHYENVSAGDVYFIPSGRIHNIGKGICLVEIQQTSDVTYRIYDFDRTDDSGKPREMHIDESVDALDFNTYPEYKTKYKPVQNGAVELVKSTYFETNYLDFKIASVRDYSKIDSFVILICLEGNLEIWHPMGRTMVYTGQCVLIPACINAITLLPHFSCKVLETFVP